MTTNLRGGAEERPRIAVSASREAEPMDFGVRDYGRHVIHSTRNRVASPSARCRLRHNSLVPTTGRASSECERKRSFRISVRFPLKESDPLAEIRRPTGRSTGAVYGEDACETRTCSVESCRAGGGISFKEIPTSRAPGACRRSGRGGAVSRPLVGPRDGRAYAKPTRSGGQVDARIRARIRAASGQDAAKGRASERRNLLAFSSRQ